MNVIFNLQNDGINQVLSEMKTLDTEIIDIV